MLYVYLAILTAVVGLSIGFALVALLELAISPTIRGHIRRFMIPSVAFLCVLVMTALGCHDARVLWQEGHDATDGELS